MKTSKKLLSLLLAFIMVFAVACGSTDTKKDGEKKAEGGKNIETLKVQFVPSRDTEDVVTVTKPLVNLLKEHLGKDGYEVDNIEISVGTSYEAVGEALSSGSVDVGFIPGGTYALYDDGAEVILTAARKGLKPESEDPTEWNKNKPTTQSDQLVTFYRSMVLAGPSEKGRELAKKINSGEKLTWEDLNSAKWGVQSASSSAGYIYPTLWLKDNYGGKSISDLANVVQVKGYPAAMAQLASGQLDIIVGYSDARLDNVDKWSKEWGGKDIWADTDIIGLSSKIYNDTISVSKESEIMDENLKKALQKAFIEIAKTEEGKKVIKIYNHEGYQEAKSADYDKEREAQEIMKGLKKEAK